MSNYQTIKNLLDNDNTVCNYATDIPDLRKIIAALKDKEKFTIYTIECDCGLTVRKHKCYEKDWAS